MFKSINRHLPDKTITHPKGGCTGNSLGEDEVQLRQRDHSRTRRWNLFWEVKKKNTHKVEDLHVRKVSFSANTLSIETNREMIDRNVTYHNLLGTWLQRFYELLLDSRWETC